MLPTLVAGLSHRLVYQVPRDKTVPFLFPDVQGGTYMPEVLATAYMIGLMEWCCAGAIAAHLEPGEGSLGTLVEVTHEAATPAGFTVIVEATLEKVDGRALLFSVIARDGHDVIGRGRHGRSVVRWDRFESRLKRKIEATSGEGV